MADKRSRQPLRTIGDLLEATEDLYNRLETGQLDAKTADAMNTVIKSSTYLLAKLPMDAYKIFVQAKIKKIEIPEGLRKALPITVD